MQEFKGTSGPLVAKQDLENPDEWLITRDWDAGQTGNGPVVVKVSITDKRVTLTIHATPDVVILREELLK